MRDGGTPAPRPGRPWHRGPESPRPDTAANPLRRPCDRTRTRWQAGLALAVVAAVVCGMIAAQALWRNGERVAREQARHRHETAAVTLSRATDPLSGPGSAQAARADASWRAPDGAPRSGKVDVPPRTSEGATVTIWVDDTGAVTRAPRAAADGIVVALGGGTLLAALLSFAAVGVVGARLRRLESHTFEEWEREWTHVEPLWTRRRPTEPGPDDV
ncbi:hypothetical protein ABZZ79_06035 [Streptomyces sp. NPDC006458]|uniref:Rv1733c family protein n=1 Tax=Streptomyces sp. NPDC006458 TaxID=3154302 RepID=UPI0033B45E71